MTQIGVVGAGPAGAAAVLALHKMKKSVLWLVRPQERRSAVGEHLAPEAISVLARLGLDDILCSTHHLESPGIVSYWGGSGVNERDYIWNPFGSGWNLDRTRFDGDLVCVAKQHGAETIELRRVDAIVRQGDKWRMTVTTSQGQRVFHVGFLVDATGRNASLMRRLGRRLERYDRLVGLFAQINARFQKASPADARLLIEPMADGWWYSLILRNGKLIAVYLTDTDLLSAGVEAARRLWRERFATSEATKSRADAESPLRSFCVAPAHTQCCLPAAGDGWLAVGDACMAFDPLAASGITKALQDGFDAAEAIAAFLNGHAAALEMYTHQRRRTFETYLEARRSYYRQERRWPSSDFWTRRQLPSGAVGATVASSHNAMRSTHV